MSALQRVSVDFNHQNEDRKVWLNTHGSLRDLAPVLRTLKPGMIVLLHDAELEVEATLELFSDGLTWLAIPNWNTIRYFDEMMPPTSTV